MKLSVAVSRKISVETAQNTNVCAAFAGRIAEVEGYLPHHQRQQDGEQDQAGPVEIRLRMVTSIIRRRRRESGSQTQKA